MKRHPALIPLSREHQKALILSYRLKNGRSSNPKFPWPTLPTEQRQKAAAIFELDILFHFAAEEQFLFPLLQQYVTSEENTLEKCRTEHQQIRELLSHWNAYQGDELVNALQQLGQLLEDHVHREERELFEWAQQVVPKAELNKIEQAVNTYYAGLAPRLCWD